jgi:hypothetical protein
MKIISLIILLITISNNGWAEDCPTLPIEIQNAIEQHISNLKAFEYCNARKLKSEKGITIAIYTAEGACVDLDPQAAPGTCSNKWVRYIVSLKDKKVSQPIEVGEKGGFSDQNIKISSKTIELRGLSNGKNDPLCCPSIPTTKKFKITQSGLIETHP